jgi:hypothetical protein
MDGTGACTNGAPKPAALGEPLKNGGERWWHAAQLLRLDGNAIFIECRFESADFIGNVGSGT